MSNSVPVVIYFHNMQSYQCHINEDMANPNGVFTLRDGAKNFFPWAAIAKVDFIRGVSPKPVVGYNTPQPHVPI